MKLEPMTAELLGKGFALSAAGLSSLGTVHWNLAVPGLYEQVIQRGEARLSAGGALVALTGARTGRSPLDRFIVQDVTTAEEIWWGEVNRPITKDVFDGMQMRVAAYLRGRDVFVQDLFAGADPNYRLPVRVITEQAWHSLFARNMFIRPTREDGAASRRASPSSTRPASRPTLSATAHSRRRSSCSISRAASCSSAAPPTPARSRNRSSPP